MIPSLRINEITSWRHRAIPAAIHFELLTPAIDKIIEMNTDYGQPERAFFQKSQTFALGQTNWADFFEAFGVFSAKLSAPILIQVFHYSTITSTKN